MTWFEVHALVKVQAVDETEAINRVAEAIRAGYVQPVYPIGEFNAQVCEDPTVYVPRRVVRDDMRCRYCGTVYHDRCPTQGCPGRVCR